MPGQNLLQKLLFCKNSSPVSEVYGSKPQCSLARNSDLQLAEFALNFQQPSTQEYICVLVCDGRA